MGSLAPGLVFGAIFAFVVLRCFDRYAKKRGLPEVRFAAGAIAIFGVFPLATAFVAGVAYDSAQSQISGVDPETANAFVPLIEIPRSSDDVNCWKTIYPCPMNDADFAIRVEDFQRWAVDEGIQLGECSATGSYLEWSEAPLNEMPQIVQVPERFEAALIGAPGLYGGALDTVADGMLTELTVAYDPAIGRAYAWALQDRKL